MNSIQYKSLFAIGSTCFEPVCMDPDLLGELASVNRDRGTRITDPGITYVGYTEPSYRHLNISVPALTLERDQVNAATLWKDLITRTVDHHYGIGQSATQVHASSTATDTAKLNEKLTREVRKAKVESLIQLLNEWLEETSGYDEETWPALMEGIEASRLSHRNRFRV